MLDVVMWWALIQRILNKSLRHKNTNTNTLTFTDKHTYNTQIHKHIHTTTESHIMSLKNKHTICLPSPAVNNYKNYWARAKGDCILHVIVAISIWSFHVYICCTTVLVSPFFMCISLLCFSGMLHGSWKQCWPVSRFRAVARNVMFVTQQYQMWGSNCNTQYRW